MKKRLLLILIVAAFCKPLMASNVSEVRLMGFKQQVKGERESVSIKAESYSELKGSGVANLEDVLFEIEYGKRRISIKSAKAQMMDSEMIFHGTTELRIESKAKRRADHFSMRGSQKTMSIQFVDSTIKSHLGSGKFGIQWLKACSLWIDLTKWKWRCFGKTGEKSGSF